MCLKKSYKYVTIKGQIGEIRLRSTCLISQAVGGTKLHV